MNVKRTEQIWIKPNKDISRMSHISKNMYNEANYVIRQEFINNHKFISYKELYPEKRSSENAFRLPAQTVQQVLRSLEKNWLSFFRSIKEWKKEPEKYKEDDEDIEGQLFNLAVEEEKKYNTTVKYLVYYTIETIDNSSSNKLMVA